MHVFWELGFEGATFANLESATGVHRQSLVYAFGDKHELFVRALRHYAETQVGAIVDILEGEGDALARLESALEAWRVDACRETAAGCLVVNTMADLGRSDEAVHSILSTTNQRLIGAFETAMREAQADGAVRSDVSAERLARQAVAVGDGVMIHARGGTGSEMVDAAFTSFLDLIRMEAVSVADRSSLTRRSTE